MPSRRANPARKAKSISFRRIQPDPLLRAYNALKIGPKTCFLCGVRLGGRNSSSEHVFPLWLQQRFGLLDLEIILVNQTTIPYRHLKIPCCKTCNNEHLSKVENAVERAVANGPDAVRALPSSILLVWLSKILYGLLYKEHFLRFDRANPLKGRLVRREFLARFKSLHYFMQACRISMEFSGFTPGSIFVFRTQLPDDPLGQFDFGDNPLFMTVAIRMGSVGIIGHLIDGGAQQGLFGDLIQRYQPLGLNPLQFAELAAQVFYRASLFDRVPKYLSAENDGHIIVHQMPIGGLSRKPIFRDWDPATYARVLSARTGYPIEQLYVPPDKIWTFLDDGKGNVPLEDINHQTWKVGDRLERWDAANLRMPRARL